MDQYTNDEVFLQKLKGMVDVLKGNPATILHPKLSFVSTFLRKYGAAFAAMPESPPQAAAEPEPEPAEEAKATPAAEEEEINSPNVSDTPPDSCLPFVELVLR